MQHCSLSNVVEAKNNIVPTCNLFACFSPTDRGTEKHVYLPYRGTIPFWFYLVPLRLVSIFLNVGRDEISCGLLPTRFSTMLL